MPRIKGASQRDSAATTREQLVDTAQHLLGTEGFARTTTRAIAEHSGCNQALISYHYGSLNRLLLAALDRSIDARAERWRVELERVRSWKGLRRLAARLYREDRDAGHVRLLAEMVAGGLMDRELGRQVANRIRPWTELVEDALTRFIPAPLGRRIPITHLAYGTVASFLGLAILEELFEDHERTDALLDRLAKSSSRQHG